MIMICSNITSIDYACDSGNYKQGLNKEFIPKLSKYYKDTIGFIPLHLSVSEFNTSNENSYDNRIVKTVNELVFELPIYHFHQERPEKIIIPFKDTIEDVKKYLMPILFMDKFGIEFSDYILGSNKDVDEFYTSIANNHNYWQFVYEQFQANHYINEHSKKYELSLLVRKCKRGYYYEHLFQMREFKIRFGNERQFESELYLLPL